MQRKIAVGLCLFALVACSKHDPILPGVRTPIFGSDGVNVLNTENPNPGVALGNALECPYTIDDKNIVWDGDRKIFSGFATGNSVHGNNRPACDGKYVYAGLSTGELVKINPKNKSAVWVADIYRPSNMTGGASLVDIVVAPVVSGRYVFVGGLGDAFCKLDAASGVKKWCIDIGVAHDFIITDTSAFVVATDGMLYSINNTNGTIYWATMVKKPNAPKYDGTIITVGRERFGASTGEKIK